MHCVLTLLHAKKLASSGSAQKCDNLKYAISGGKTLKETLESCRDLAARLREGPAVVDNFIDQGELWSKRGLGAQSGTRLLFAEMVAGH